MATAILTIFKWSFLWQARSQEQSQISRTIFGSENVRSCLRTIPIDSIIRKHPGLEDNSSSSLFRGLHAILSNDILDIDTKVIFHLLWTLDYSFSYYSHGTLEHLASHHQMYQRERLNIKHLQSQGSSQHMRLKSWKKTCYKLGKLLKSSIVVVLCSTSSASTLFRLDHI